MDEDKEIECQEFDFDEAAELCGLSGMQSSFARAILRGANKTQAARSAGYSGSDEQLRSAGYKAFNSPKVQAFLSLAKKEGYGVTDELGDAEELKRILWKHARGDDKNHAIRATEVLHRIEREEESVSKETEWDPDEFARKVLNYKWGEPLLALLWSSLVNQPHGSIVSMPLRDEILPVLRRSFPDVWAVLRDEFARSRFPEELVELDAIAARPLPNINRNEATP